MKVLTWATLVAGAIALATALVSAIVLVASRIRRGQAQPELVVEPADLEAEGANLPQPEPPAPAVVQPAASAADAVQTRPLTARRTLVAAVLTFAAAVLMLLSAAAFAQVRFNEWWDFFPAAGLATLLMLGGIGMLGLALWQTPYRLPFELATESVVAGRVSFIALVAGLVVLAIGTVMGGAWVPDSPPVNAHIQFLTLLAGVVITAWALSGAPRRVPRRAASVRTEVVAVGLLTLLAFGLRLIEAGTIVPGLLDEIHTLDGMNFVRDGNLPLLRQASTFQSVSLVHYYFVALGTGLVGDTLAGLRFSSAVIGALYLPAVYLLTRELFNRRTAVVAALILLTFPLQMHYSRVSLWHITDPLFGAWAIALFALAFRRGHRWAWVWGGVALGMTQYFFEGGRYVFPLATLAWFIWLLISRPRRTRPHWRGMALGLVTAGLVALPLYATMLYTHGPFASRFNDSGGASYVAGLFQNYSELDAFSQHIAVRQLFNPFLIYVSVVDRTGSWFGLDQPMVLPILVPLLLLGVGHSLWRLRSLGIVVLGVVLTTSFGNILMRETLDYVRYIIVTPFIPILIAIGLRYTLPMLWPTTALMTSNRLKKAGRITTVVLAAGITIGQAIYYFGPFRAEYAVSIRDSHGGPDAQEAALRIAELPDGERYQILLVTRTDQDLHVARALNGFLSHPTDQLEVIRSDSFTEDYLLKLPRDRAYAFFLEPADAESYRRLAEAFPLGPPDYSTDWLLPADEEYLLFLVQPPGNVTSN